MYMVEGTALLEAELGAVPLLASLQPAQRREAMQRVVYTAVTAGDTLRLPGRAHAAMVSALSPCPCGSQHTTLAFDVGVPS